MPDMAESLRAADTRPQSIDDTERRSPIAELPRSLPCARSYITGDTLVNRFASIASVATIISSPAVAQTVPTPVTTYPYTPYIFQEGPDTAIRGSTWERYYSQMVPMSQEPTSPRVTRVAKSLEVEAQGSNVPRGNPLSSDWGQAVSIFKRNYWALDPASVVPGEIDAYMGVVRQDRGDANVYSANAQIVDRNLAGTTLDGFISLFEGRATSIAPGSLSLLQDIDVQLGAIDTVNRADNATPGMLGVHAVKQGGAGGVALNVTAINGASWKNGLSITNNGSIQLLQNTNDASLFVAGPITAGGRISGPAWTTLPASALQVSSLSGTIADASAYGRYGVVGKTATLNLQVHIETNGSAAGAVVVTLPMAAAATPYIFILAGRDNQGSGKMLQGILTGNTLKILTYDNLYPGHNLADLYITGSYEVP